MSSKVYIHIGLHKTSSTFLQTSVFPVFDNINFLCGWNGDLRSIFNDPSKNDKRLLISDEDLSGKFWGADYLPGINDDGYWTLFQNNMQWIKEIFPEGSIILGLRKHSGLMSSLYKQYIHEGGYLSYNETISIFGPESVLSQDDFSFAKRICYLHKLFEGRVYLYFQEDISSDLIQVIDDLASYLGTTYDVDKIHNKSYNVGVKNKQLDLLRNMNFLHHKMKVFLNLDASNPFITRTQWYIRKLFQDYMKILQHIKKPIDGFNAQEIDSFYAEDYEFARLYQKSLHDPARRDDYCHRIDPSIHITS